jgi:hypothetical protein
MCKFQNTLRKFKHLRSMVIAYYFHTRRTFSIPQLSGNGREGNV